MAKKSEKKGKPAPPSAGLAFVIGLILFGAILCPVGVIVSYNIELNLKLGVKLLQSLSLGCFMGLGIAIIPAFIFMHMTIKKH